MKKGQLFTQVIENGVLRSQKWSSLLKINNLKELFGGFGGGQPGVGDLYYI